MMSFKGHKPVSSRVMAELAKFMRESSNNSSRSVTSDFNLDICTAFPSCCEPDNFNDSRSQNNVTAVAQTTKLKVPKSRLFLEDENGHKHRLEFHTSFRSIKPILLSNRELFEKKSERSSQVKSKISYQSTVVPWLKKEIFRKKYKVMAAEDDLMPEGNELEEVLRKERKKMKEMKNLAAIYLLMNDMMIRFDTTDNIQIAQTVKKRMPVSSDGNNASLFCIIDEDIHLIVIDIHDVVLEQMVPIKDLNIATYDKMIHLKGKSCINNRSVFYSVPISTYQYTDPRKKLKKNPNHYLKNPPQWLKNLRRLRVSHTTKTNHQLMVNQCNSIKTSWFVLETDIMRIRAHSGIVLMNILHRKEAYERWIVELQTANEEPALRSSYGSCSTCKLVNLFEHQHFTSKPDIESFTQSSFATPVNSDDDEKSTTEEEILCGGSKG